MSLESRVKDPKKRGLITSKIGQLTPAYCVLCGKQDGFVTEEGTGLIITVCDDCHETAGDPPGLQPLWQEELNAYVRDGKHR